jgi:thioredoxin 1
MAFDAPINTSEANLPKVLNTGLPVVLVLTAPHAGGEVFNSALNRVAKAAVGRALVAKVNVADEPGVARKYGVSALPAVIFVKEGKNLATAIGAADEASLNRWVDYLARGEGAQPTVPSGPSVPVAGVSAGQSGASSGPSGTSTGPRPGSGPAPQARPAGAAASTTRERTAGDGQPVDLTDATFDQAIRNSKVPVLVDFWAPWCGPCRMVAPAVADLARDFAGRANVYKVNVDDNPGVAGRYGIQGIPALLIFKNGQIVEQIVGAQPANVLRQKLARHVEA